MTPYEKELLETLRRSFAETLGLIAGRWPYMGPGKAARDSIVRLERTLDALSPVEVTRQMCHEVRNREGCPTILQARQALEAVNGDVGKACERLRKMGLA